MKTKFILSGGYANHPNEENNKFFREILNTDKRKLKILLILFAKEIETWEEKEQAIISQFKINKQGKSLSYEVAQEDNFLRQCREADIVYMHGGRTLKLLETLKKFSNLKDLWAGKIVAGESAGSYVLSTCFYSKSEQGIFSGLGLVPVKTICHYQGENREKLQDCPKNLEELLLADYEYKVFEI